jgi:hypothetical protein
LTSHSFGSIRHPERFTGTTGVRRAAQKEMPGAAVVLLD